MRKTFSKAQITLLTLGLCIPLLSQGQSVHDPNLDKEPSTPAVAVPLRSNQEKSKYDLLAEKLESFAQSSDDGSTIVNLEGDELKVRLGTSEMKTVAQNILKLKSYRDAVEKQCKVTDESAALLVNTLDSCLTEKLIYPSVLKGKLNNNRIEVFLSLKALNTCRSELAAYFEEKEKKTDLTEKEAFKHDHKALESLNYVFEHFGVNEAKKDLSIAANSELVKSLKNVSSANLCQVKLEGAVVETPKKDEKDASKKPKQKKDAVKPSPESLEEHSRSNFEESTDVTIEEEETYIPIAPKKIIEQKPAQPAPQPAPVYQAPKPTFQPVPYQPAPIPEKRNDFEPVPRKRNNAPAFIPAARPATGKVPVATGGGPVPVGGGFPIARSFGLSLGFGSYSSNVTAPLIPPPMPYYPTQMPMGGLPMTGGGPIVTSASSVPRACLVCSSAPTTMPVLGLNTMLARPCLPQQTTVATNINPAIGACRPNMNLPWVGTTGVNPYFNQIPRGPGTGIVPGSPVLQGGSVPANRNTVPRTAPTLARGAKRRVRR